MIYKIPHINKVYEALTAVIDGRITIISHNTDIFEITTIIASVQTSSRDKSYIVQYQPSTHQIMSNDNSTYRNNELSYPMIGLMFVLGELPYDPIQANKLANIHRKAINQQYQNNWNQSVNHVLTQIDQQ